jgi:cytochrome c
MGYRNIALGLAGAAGIAGLAQGSLAQTAPSGQQLFQQRCAMCHASTAAARNTMGPNLAGVAGRKAGATTFAYSPAMKNAKITWNRATLDQYLAAPARMVPGTKMAVSVPNAAQRAVIVSHLLSVR